jgi:hypothetical protein
MHDRIDEVDVTFRNWWRWTKKRNGGGSEAGFSFGVRRLVEPLKSASTGCDPSSNTTIDNNEGTREGVEERFI